MKKLSRITEGILGDIARRDLSGEKKKEDNIKILYYPKTKDELRDIIRHEIKTQDEDHLDLRMIDVSNVINMDSIFYGLSNLISLDVSNWNVRNVKNMVSMFYGCTNLISLDVSNWDVRNVENMNHMFSFCKNLISLDVSNWDMSSVKNMEKMFDKCRFNYKKEGNRLIKI